MKNWIVASLGLALSLSANDKFQGWKEMRVVKSERSEIYVDDFLHNGQDTLCLLYTSPSPRD